MSDRPVIQLSETLTRLRRHLAQALRSQSSLTADAAARADRVALVAEVAMARIAQLSKLEESLIRMAPLSDERVRSIADTAAWAMARIVQDQIEDPYRRQEQG
jgi:hypothetical protein